MNTVAYCIDRNYWEPLQVSLFSLLSHSSKPLEIYVVTDDLTTKEKEALLRLARSFKGSSLNFLKPQRETLRDLPLHLYFTQANFDRIFLPHLLPQGNKPILYLDADTLVQGDVDELFSIFQPGFALAACPDHLGTLGNPVTRVENPELYGASANQPYFNSGVMLINAPLWREQNISQAVANFCAKYPETLFLAEQSALNIVLRGKVQFLPPQWNVQTVHPNILNGTWNFPYLSQDHSKAKLLHYTTEFKPWSKGVHLPEASAYQSTLRSLKESFSRSEF